MNASTTIFYPLKCDEEFNADFLTDSTSTPPSASTPDRSGTPDVDDSPACEKAGDDTTRTQSTDCPSTTNAVFHHSPHASLSSSSHHRTPQFPTCSLSDRIRNIQRASAAAIHGRNPHGGGQHVPGRGQQVDDSTLAGTIRSVMAKALLRRRTSWFQDVWRYDLEWAFREIANIVEDYNYVAIDTEFPGFLINNDDPSLTQSSRNYSELRDNVNQMSVIQLGLTFSDEFGNRPKISTFQFNFRFNLRTDRYSADSIAILTGVDFDRLGAEGIDVRVFAEHMLASGLVLNGNIRWICFHGMYDFGYLTRILTNLPLPETPMLYFEQMYLFFPKLVDLKYMLRDSYAGGLDKLGSIIGVERVGAQHTGGSDAQLTSDIFFKVVALADRSDAFSGYLFGLEPEEFTESDQWSWNLYNKNYYKHNYLHFYGPAAGRRVGGGLATEYEKWCEMLMRAHPQIMY